tara:strand:- start:1303 stop:1473 length:171 start_codon:yes stop_codon:yes gene_type:complete
MTSYFQKVFFKDGLPVSTVWKISNGTGKKIIAPLNVKGEQLMIDKKLKGETNERIN